MTDDIDFLKWLFDKAEGFKYRYPKKCYNDHAIEIPGGERKQTNNILFKPIFYPLLLQRAIESVNNDNSQFFINQNHTGLVVQDRFEYEIQFKSLELEIDQAKESSLRYIYEQEKKDEN